MRLSHRITLLIVALLSVTALSVAASLIWLGDRALTSRADSDSRAIAGLLADGASLAALIPGIVTQEVGRQMIAEATLAGMMVDAARQGGISDFEINLRLAEAAARTALDEIWVLKPDGLVVYGTNSQYDPPNPGQRDESLAHAFEAVAQGRRWAESKVPLELPDYSKPMAFAAVRLGDGHLVVVGQNLGVSDDLRRRIGPSRTIETMVGQADIQAVWIFSEAEAVLAGTNLGGHASPTSAELAGVREAIQSGRTKTIAAKGATSVVSPLLDADRLPIGTVLVRFSTAQAEAAAHRNIAISVGLAALLLAFGAIAARLVSGRISGPILAIADAARAVHDRSFRAAMLASVGGRADEIGGLARDFTKMAEQVLAREEELDRLVALRTAELAERNSQLTQAVDAIQADLDAARALQQAILPQVFPDRASLSGKAVMTAARHVGGDFYDFFMVDEEHMAVLIADVSGKGIPAALFMAVSRTVLRARAIMTPSPAECVPSANDEIVSQNPQELFITVFYGLLNIRTGDFRYVNAGHLPPVHVSRSGIVRIACSRGMALGVMDGLSFREDRMTLAEGDTLVLYTDGVSEAMNEGDQEFTDQRVLDSVGRHAGKPVGDILDGLVADVAEFVGEAPPSDDLTCIVLRYLGGGTVSVSARGGIEVEA
ncbi:MAG: PP2C family protein-serine/threonine phosphatase [Alphaproteobacteria bacterium]|nr:PP2C family protein-serine/threonine phosphatase [Alphaproteobacteria bacterium]